MSIIERKKKEQWPSWMQDSTVGTTHCHAAAV